MSFSTIEFSVEDNIATITLNRPDAANAMNPQMAKELSECAKGCQENADIRAVIIQANGKMFCAGGDLSEFAAAKEAVGSLLLSMTADLHLFISRLTRMNAPVIAAVQGTAAGAGFSLAAAADITIAADRAKFTMAYTNAGLSPDGSSTYFLPRRIGDRKTRELMLTNRVLSAAEAVDWGIINQAVAAEELEPTVSAIAAQLANGPTLAFGSVKALLNQSFDNSLETQMELEAKSIASLSRSPDGHEGIQAFLAKRPAEFTGKD
ncbi:MAG: enoyl-CoA hydratase [Gammaproteobacteria bacterium]|jgi:2-(1,2-epoxy-1,2-dihydrophenyl)acetyl-CoA isomerase|nr:enoyl-CoA hydratase [Gammaproteobacteria bacterium]MBT5600662.1 enoyl-CoA hydratase [Gammaproteobacteria bacterium]MBT6247520.1 enoyl-CoA hydratase [Gammaproteobacteria bacterium]